MKVRWMIWYKREEKMLRRMFVSTFAISSLFILILGLLNNSYTTRIVQQQANKADMLFLQHASDTIDRHLYDIQINLMQLLSTPYFYSEYNADLDAKLDAAVITQKVTPVLNAFLVNNKYLDDLSLYLENIGIISTNYGLHRAELIPERQLIDRQLQQEAQSVWYSGIFHFRITAGAEGGVTLVNKFPYDRDKPTIGLMLATINEHKLKETIGQSAVYEGQFLTVLDDAGNRIVSTSSVPFTQEFDKAIWAEAKGQTSFAFRYQNVDYFVSTVKSAYSHWKYYDVIPLKELQKESRGIVRIAIFMVCILLVLAATAALVNSRWLYRPLHRLLLLMRGGEGAGKEADDLGYAYNRWEEMQHTASELNRKLANQIPILRETVILQLLQGHYRHYSSEQLRQIFVRYDLPTEGDKAVLAMTFDLAGKNPGRFLTGDKDLILFALKNIVGDLLESTLFEGLLVHLPNDTLVISLWLPAANGSDGALATELDRLAEYLREGCESYLKVSVTVGVGGITGDEKDLPHLYQQALMALESRIVRGVSKVLHSPDSLGSGGSYPIELENRYEYALKAGDAEEAERLLYEFSDYVQGVDESAGHVLTFYNQLLAVTLRTAYSVNMDVPEIVDAEDPFTLLRRQKSLEELNDCLLERFVRPIADFVQRHKQAEYANLVEKAIHFIREEHGRDISLAECAEYCEVSVAHLTRHFRKLTGMSFLDYVTQFRLQRAKELLSQTDLAIGDISEMVGYQRINFMRVFKKTEGMTPGQYRDRCREQSGK